MTSDDVTSSITIVKRRGRPLGFKLTDFSKNAISNSKRGQQHSQETKDKISKSLALYFRLLNPYSEEVANTYCKGKTNEATREWLNSVKEALDDYDIAQPILTDRAMENTRRIEITYGTNIELFSSEATPEELLELKELCIEMGINFNDYMRHSL